MPFGSAFDGKSLYSPGNTPIGVPMDRTLDEFLKAAAGRMKSEESPRKKKKRLKSTSLESFLPEEHVNYFKQLRIGSKRIRNARIEEL